ncbi:MAG: M24 family metallopeptidase [Waltera sp.]
MMHYEATPDNCATLEPEGMLLVDSGGQYLGGTTDVTRTIVLGPISEEIKKHYTMVAAAVMQLTHAHWLYGCTGRNLDILARQPIWDMDIDYQCGTGHGVGYILNVHKVPRTCAGDSPEVWWRQCLRMVWISPMSPASIFRAATVSASRMLWWRKMM